jgi:hypothetical protein
MLRCQGNQFLAASTQAKIYISEQQESLVVAAAVACADFVQPDVLHCQSSDGKQLWWSVAGTSLRRTSSGFGI